MSEMSDYADKLKTRIAELEQYVTSAEIAFREKNDRIAELEAEIHKLKTQHEYEAMGLRALLQNERDHYKALEQERDKYKAMLIGEINRYTTLEKSMAAPPKDILDAVCKTIEVLHDAITKHVSTGVATEMLRERLGINIRQGDTQPAGLLALMNYTFDLEKSQMPARIKELYDECAKLRWMKNEQ